MPNEILEALKQIDLYFQSGNDIQIERATIPFEEWKPIQQFLRGTKENGT